MSAVSVLQKRGERMKDKCLRCGACCGDCRYLVHYIDGKTRCMIYNIRLGALTVPGEWCHHRDEVPFDYPNCPYNKGFPMKGGSA